MVLEPDGGQARSLPQGCQLEQAYTAREWEEFVACARNGVGTGEGLDKEFCPKIADHGVVESDVRHAIRRSSCLVAYVHEGHGRVALWDSERTGLFVVAREASGLVFNAFVVDDLPRYIRGLQDVRWLRPL